MDGNNAEGSRLMQLSDYSFLGKLKQGKGGFLERVMQYMYDICVCTNVYARYLHY
jgi:hypothetical protein